MTVLIVDDEQLNINILEDYLKDEGFNTIAYSDPLKVLENIDKHTEISLVLLDNMMPNLNGIELLKKMKEHEYFQDIPVIMQTAVADSTSFAEGINAGAYYYLTKPYKKDMLLSVVNAAINDNRYKSKIITEVKKNRQILGLLRQSVFEYKTIIEAQNLAYLLANSFPHPEKVVIGLSELLINAVEHGNYGVGYANKKRLILSGQYEEELKNLEKSNQHKSVNVIFNKGDDGISVIIEDSGNGFDSGAYMEISPERASDPNGRGIAIAKMMSFDSIEYSNDGKKVCCKVKL